MQGPEQGLVTGQKSKQRGSQGKQPLPNPADQHMAMANIWDGQKGMLQIGWEMGKAPIARFEYCRTEGKCWYSEEVPHSETIMHFHS